MRAAVMETVANKHESSDASWGGAAKESVHSRLPTSRPREILEGGGAGSDAHAGRGAEGEGKRPKLQQVDERDEDRDDETFAIRADACYVMARACELFAMDMTKRSELVLEDNTRARFDPFDFSRLHSQASASKDG